MATNNPLPLGILLMRGAALWLMAALLLAWCLVGLNLEFTPLQALFPGKTSRLLQAHLDYLLMSALLFGFAATGIGLPRLVAWAMVVGACTNSSLFWLMAMFPQLDGPQPQADGWLQLFKLYTFASIVTTSYGFGRAAWCLLAWTRQRSGAA